MNKISKTKIAIGASLIAGLATGCSSFIENPFGIKDVKSPDKTQKMKGGSCGEAKCGSKMKDKMKGGSCGEAKCGSKMKDKTKGGSCGEAKCGSKMPKKTKTPAEGRCGSNK